MAESKSGCRCLLEPAHELPWFSHVDFLPKPEKGRGPGLAPSPEGQDQREKGSLLLGQCGALPLFSVRV